MVTYTVNPGESLEQLLKRAGYDYEKLSKANKPTLIANIMSQKKATPSYDDLPDEFKVAKKKGGGEGEVAIHLTALVRYFKHQSAEKKKERAEAAKERSRGGALGVSHGRVSKR